MKQSEGMNSPRCCYMPPLVADGCLLELGDVAGDHLLVLVLVLELGDVVGDEAGGGPGYQQPGPGSTHHWRLDIYTDIYRYLDIYPTIILLSRTSWRCDC